MEKFRQTGSKSARVDNVCYAADIAGLLHQMWCCAISWVVVIAVVEITKPFSGRLRPDFIARCQPMELVNASFTGDMFSSTLGSGLSEATLGPVHLGQTVGKCTNPSLETVKQGRFRCAHQQLSQLCWQHACELNAVLACVKPVRQPVACNFWKTAVPQLAGC